MLEETEKGWKGKAIEHYQKFLDFWKDADLGIAEVEDAKNRKFLLCLDTDFFVFDYKVSL